MRGIKRVIICLTIVIFFASANFMSCGEAAIQKRVLAISDIHFTPFSDTSIVKKLVDTSYEKWDDVFAKSKDKKIANYGQETNPALYNLMLSSLKKQSKNISHIIFTGDILCHDFNEQFVALTGKTNNYERNKFINKTIEYVTSKLSKTFPKLPIYFSLGNNDTYSGDYDMNDDGEFLHSTADIFYSNLINDKESKADFYNTYPVHGYYNVKMKGIHGMRLISLNTFFLSVNYINKGMNDPGNDELNWLESQLELAKKQNQKIWLIYHIPPGVNVFSTQRSGTSPEINVKLQWKDSYNKRYLDLVKTFHEQIAAEFSGHTHMDDFRLIYNDSDHKQAINMIHINPAISPVFKNNPAYQMISVDYKTGELTDTTTYYVDLKALSPKVSDEYTFSKTYGYPPNINGLDKLYKSIPQDKQKQNLYTKYYSSSSDTASISSSWQWYWCGAGNLMPEDYVKALKAMQTVK